MTARDQVLFRARLAAESGMIDKCQIRRQIGHTTDTFSGTQIPEYGDVYVGPCRVQQRLTQSENQQAGQQAMLFLAVEVQIPMSVTNVSVGDEMRMLESRDDDLPSRVFIVRDLAHKTDASARRIQAIERTR
jgi:hypothetical protein